MSTVLGATWTAPARGEPTPAGTAAASPVGAQAQAPAEFERYGLQILAADLVSTGLLVGALVADSSSVSPPLLVAGLAAWAIVPPVIHGVHRNPLGLVSLSARIGIPLGTALVLGVALAGRCHNDSCGDAPDLLGSAIGFFGGAVVVSAIDAIYMARRRIPLAPPANLAVLPSRHGATLAIGGRF